MKLKHIHARVGRFNGSLYFVVDNRLLRVNVGTPQFNDFNEWRLNEFILSQEPYKPEENDVELNPYDIKDIDIDENDLNMLEFASKCSDLNYKFDEAELARLQLLYPDIIEDLAGVMYKGETRLTIMNDNTPLRLEDWDKGEKTSFQKVFYPILEGFRLGYLKAK